MEGSFTSRGAQFGSSERDPVGFNGCEIRCAAHFVSAVFHGPAQFMDLTVGKQANFSGARFEHSARRRRAWRVSGRGLEGPCRDVTPGLSQSFSRNQRNLGGRHQFGRAGQQGTPLSRRSSRTGTRLGALQKRARIP